MPTKTRSKVRENPTPEGHVRCLPSFIVVGAQKAGSTALFSYFLLHDQFRVGYTKEAHFFDQHSQTTLSQYLRKMPILKDDDQILGSTFTGEATPAYMLGVGTAQGISLLFPWMRLIAILRDPTERMYSEYKMKERRVIERAVDESPEFLEMLGREIKRCTETPPAAGALRGARRKPIERKLSETNRTAAREEGEGGGEGLFEDDPFVDDSFEDDPFEDDSGWAIGGAEKGPRRRRLQWSGDSSHICLRHFIGKSPRLRLVMPRKNGHEAATKLAECLIADTRKHPYDKAKQVEAWKACFRSAGLRTEAVLPLLEEIDVEMQQIARCVAPCDSTPPMNIPPSNPRPLTVAPTATGAFETWFRNTTMSKKFLRRRVGSLVQKLSQRRGGAPLTGRERMRLVVEMASGLANTTTQDLAQDGLTERGNLALRVLADGLRPSSLCFEDVGWSAVPRQGSNGTATKRTFLWGRRLDCWPRGSSSNIAYDFVVRGIYVEQVRDLLRWFPREQLLFLDSGEMRDNTAAALAEVSKFLGIGAFRSNISSEDVSSAFSKQFPRFEATGWQMQSTYSPMPERTERMMRAFFAPFNRALYSVLGRDFGWEK